MWLHTKVMGVHFRLVSTKKGERMVNLYERRKKEKNIFG